jgi:Protein of unknown function (DUF2867)
MTLHRSSYIQQIPELEPVLRGADHIDIKTTTGSLTMREFIVGMMSHQPGWVTWLFGVRAIFVRFLGMRQRGLPRPRKLSPQDVPMTPGSKASFFIIRMAQEERYWVAEADDSHLKGALVVVVEPLQGNLKRFHVVTVVHYRNWAGPVYFNVIRPFHHIVVGGMVRAGSRQA